MSDVATLHAAPTNQPIAEWLHLSTQCLHHAPACQREREKRKRKKGERGCHYLALDLVCDNKLPKLLCAPEEKK